MKKILALLLAMIVCMGCLASCSEEPVVEEGATLAQAVTYLHNLYKDAAKNTPTDYDVVGKLMIGTTEFTVTWETDNELITVKESSKAGFWTVDVPAKTEAEIPYKLTATVKNAAGETQTKTYERIVPIVDNSSIVAEPEEGVAYKFYLVQANLGQTLYATHELQENKFIKSTVDPTEAPDFFAEKVDDGYKFYTMIGDAKNYITASTVTSDDGKVSKYLNYSVDAGSVWYYKTAENAWCTVVEGGEYVVGTYSSFATFCISESSYINAENSGVSQFPGGLILKETAEANKPSGDDVVIYETPEEIVNAVYELETGMVLSAAHVYTLTGMIISIDSAYSEQYGNVTVTIVVGDMEDKPIQCYRLKGEGADAIKAGDTITVSGILKNYNGTVEFDAGCTLDSYEAGEGFDVEIYETPEAILNAAYALEVGTTLSAGNPYTLTGVITTVDTEFSEQYGNVTVTIVVGDMTDKPIQCFRLKGEGAELIGVGDTVTVTGVIKNYNGKIEFDAGCTLDSYTLTEKPPVDEPDEPSEPPVDEPDEPSEPPVDEPDEPSEPPVDEPDEPSEPPVDEPDEPSEPPVDEPDDPVPPALDTPEKIVNAAYALEKDTFLAEGAQFTLTGVISSVQTPYDDGYKNVSVFIIIEGLEDKPILCYRLKGDGADKIKIGDIITVTGKIKNYNGTIEFDAGCSLDSYEAGNVEVEIYDTPKAIVDAAYTLGNQETLSGGHKYTLTGTITEIGTPYSEQYKNITVTITIDGCEDKPIVCYRLKGTGAEALAVGDVISVSGVLTNYNGTIEFTSGCTFTK